MSNYNSNFYANRYPRKYKSVDGRVYKTEAEVRDLPVRNKVVNVLKANDKMSAADLIRIEQFLSTGQVPDKKIPITAEQRQYVIEKYGLVKNGSNGRYMADEQQVYMMLCNQYPAARNFKSFKHIKYTVNFYDPRNGEVKVYKG